MANYLGIGDTAFQNNIQGRTDSSSGTPGRIPVDTYDPKTGDVVEDMPSEV